MNITDELREYIDEWCKAWQRQASSEDGIDPATLYAIADRIDAEHEKAIRELNNLADSCVLLPKDANGEYIHIGDELDGYGYPNGGAYCKAIVNEVMILVGTKDSSYTTWAMWDATEVRHHKSPTIENVLAEFALEIDPSADIAMTGAETIKKYAAKLQLKEED